MYLFSGQENKRIEQIIYGMVFFIIAVNMIIYVLTDLSVLLEKRYDLFIMLGIFILISISIETYNQKRCDNIVFNRIFSCISCIFKRISEVFFISFICAIFSYFTTAFNFPMQDEMFNGWDRALGFDWLYWFEFTKSHPVIAEILCFAYQAILPQTIWIMPLLVVLGRYKEAQLFIFLFLSTLIVTMIFSFLLPALAAYYHYNITPDMIEGVSLAAPYAHIEHVQQLRRGEMIIIDASNFKGLITFPSFHASLAVIFMICLKDVKFLNIISYVINIVMIIATPINGGHYFVDVIGGIIIVFIMYALFHKISSLKEQKT